MYANVIRTEPWAFVSRSVGAKGHESLLKGDQLWWSHIADAIRSKKRLGGTRWALLISVIAGVASSLILNPLSAGLFDSTKAVSIEDKPFRTARFSTATAGLVKIDNSTYLRAATNLLYNVSTSAWNTNRYSVASFWPFDLHEVPLGAALVPLQQAWIVESEAVRVQMQCQSLTKVVNATFDLNQTELIIQTDDGCGIKPLSGTPCGIEGGGAWGHITVQKPTRP